MSKKLLWGVHPLTKALLGTEATGSVAKDFASKISMHISLPSCQRALSFKCHHLSFRLMFTLDQHFADELGQVRVMVAD